MKYIYFLAFLFPYRSFSLDLIGLTIPNYYFLFPFLFINFIYGKKKAKKVIYVIAIFPIILTLFYVVKASEQGFSTLGLTGINLIINFIFIFLFAHYSVNNVTLFIWMIKRLILINIIYAIVQNILLLLGYDQLTMFHSNLASQINYVQPEFIYPVFRVSGFFNESSQLIIFIILSLVFLETINRNTHKYIKYILSIMSGSKTGGLYVLSFILFSNIYLMAIASFALLFITSYLLTEQPKWFLFSIMAFEHRYEGLIESFDVVIDPLIGVSFDEIIGLDFISIYYVSLGWIGVTILITYIAYTIYLSKNLMFLFLLPISLAANGALPSMQYILFVASAVILFENHKNKINLH